MLVIGGGATGAQVASVFQAFGTRVYLFQAGPRILPTEDEDVTAAVAATFRKSGIVVREGFGKIEAFEDGRYAVFVPSVPTPFAGVVYVLDATRVHPLDVSFTDALRVVSKWGSGAKALVIAKEGELTPVKGELTPVS